MNQFLLNYAPILIFLGLALCLSVFFIAIPFVLAPTKINAQKLKTYECGFDTIGSNRMQFDVRFYLIAILFIIFDIEIIFLFPWIVTMKYVAFPGYLIVMSFLLLLTIGFIYEWKKGALEWD